MLRYVASRLLVAIVAIFVLVTLTFFLLRLIPGDPLAAPRLTQEVKERLREHYGLDRPLIEQYVIYITHLLRAAFGYAVLTRGRGVHPRIGEPFRVSLALGSRARNFPIVFGLFCGILA